MQVAYFSYPVDISSRWQAPGVVLKMRKKLEVRRSLPVPIFVFDDSDQKVEFKASIKPCSHQPNFIVDSFIIKILFF